MDFKTLKKSGFTPVSSCGDMLFGDRNEPFFNIAQKNEWVMSSLQVRSKGFANGVLELLSNDRVVEQHKLLELLKYPNKVQTQYEFMQAVCLSFDIYGRSYIVYDHILQELLPLCPSSVSVIEDERGFPKSYQYTAGNKTNTILPEEMIDWKNPSPIDINKSISLFQSIKETVQSDNSASQWNKESFNGTAVDGVLSSANTIPLKKKKEIATGWKKLFSMFNRKQDVAVLDGGMSYQKIRTNPKDMDFANLSKVNKERILALYSVPLALLGNTEGLNRDNIFGIEYFFEKYTIQPLRFSFVDKLNSCIIRGFYKNKGLEFKFQDSIPSDIQAKTEKQQAQFNMGSLSPNEIREEEGKEPIKGGDDTYLPFNLSKVGEEDVEEHTDSSKKSFVIKSFNKKDIKKIYLKRFNKNENVLQKKIISLFKKQEKEVLGNFGKKSVSDYLFDKVKWRKAFYISLLPVIKNTASTEGQSALDEISEGYSFSGDTTQFKKAIETQTIRFAKQVNDTTIERLRIILQDGVDAGLGEEELSKKVQEVFTVATNSRAKMIAKTETLKASNIAHQEAYEQLGVEKKEWLAVEDSRTRPSHASADGQTVDIDDTFTVGGEKMERPGDINASASNSINCRCRIIAIIE